MGLVEEGVVGSQGSYVQMYRRLWNVVEETAVKMDPSRIVVLRQMIRAILTVLIPAVGPLPVILRHPSAVRQSVAGVMSLDKLLAVRMLFVVACIV